MESEVLRAAGAGSVTWWLNSVLAGTAALDDALDHLSGDVAGPDGERTGWLATIALLRGRGAVSVRLAVLEPGDPVGVSGPAEVTRAAVAAGLALVAPDLVLLPAPGTDCWTLLRSAPARPAALGSLSENRRIMREAMHTLTVAFPGLEPDETAAAELRRYRAFPPLTAPPGIPVRAAEIADSALRVWWLAGIAVDLSARTSEPPPPQLRGLGPAARRAVSAAFSEPPGSGH